MPKVTSKTQKALEKRTANEHDLENNDGNDDTGEHAAVADDIDNENLLEMEIPPMPELPISSDGNKKRLVISHIEVDNFKSYYGRQTIGPFHQNFTAIIGPNGSGKSNVIDSLLFVFGYRASKIRSKKISVLIHSSAGRENIASCTVSVHFKKIIIRGQDQIETVEGSEFFVSRTAFRDNSSRYSLNGRTAQFREIAIVLRECGIDLVHNRFLILQGEVEHISLMKPKAQNSNEEGMLEYLEDIIGSSRLRLPINKLMVKLGQLQEQRAYQLVRLHHAEKEQLALKESAMTVITKLRVENAIVLAQAKLHSCRKLSLLAETQELSKLHNEQTVKVEKEQKRLDELTTNLKGMKQEHKKLQKDLERKQEALNALNVELGTKKQAITKMASDKKRFADQHEKLTINIEKEKERIAELESVPEKASEKLRKYDVELTEAEEAIRENTAHIDENLPIVQEQTTALRIARQTLETELGEHITIEDKCAAELALAQEALSNLQREESAQCKILSEFKDRLARSEDEISTKTRNLETTQLNVPTLERDLKELRVEEARLTREERCLDEKTRTLRVELEQQRQATAQFHTNNSLLTALMDQKKSDRIRGIYGRLGDLGAIDAKFDVAVSTTCGALDNIVVDCVETAQLCIKFLQRENLGIASFIALDKQQHYWSRINKKPNTPENTPRLFDLVRVEDKNVLPAFYYALTDTLVASDIQTATRIAMNSGSQRWRTVTLKGEVVEVSGAMTGGGNAQRRGRIGQEVRVNTAKNNARSETDLKTLTESLKSAEEQLADTRHKLASVGQNLRERETDLNRANQLVKNLNSDIGILQKNIDSLKLQVGEQEKKVEGAVVNPEVVAQHSRIVDKLKKENDEYTKKSDSLRLRSIEIAERIDAIDDEIVGNFRRALREAEERKRTTEKGIAKEKNAIASNVRNLKNANGRKADYESDLEQVMTSIEKLEKKIENFTTQSTTLEENIEEHRSAVVEAETAYSEAVELARELNTDEIDIGKQIAKLREELKSIDDRLEHVRAKISHIDAQTSKLKLYNFDKLEGLPTDMLEYGRDDPLLADSLSVAADVFPSNSQENMDVDENEEEELMEVNTSVEQEAEVNNVEKRSCHRLPLTVIPMARVPQISNDETRDFDEVTLREHLSALETRKAAEERKDNAANVGLLVEYIQKTRLYNAELTDFQRISRERDSHREFCERLKKMRLQEFMDGFQIINEHLKEMYQMITLGGDASLDLVDSLDPFSEGVCFGVRPPKKSWKQITNLSGGEKTLASLALIFGLHRYRPSPLYVMDEIDAALDYRNVSILSYLIRDKTQNTQFVIISLRNNMFEKSNRIVGICKVNDCTRHVVFDNNLNFEEAEGQQQKQRGRRRTRTEAAN